MIGKLHRKTSQSKFLVELKVSKGFPGGASGKRIFAYNARDVEMQVQSLGRASIVFWNP